MPLKELQEKLTQLFTGRKVIVSDGFDDSIRGLRMCDFDVYDIQQYFYKVNGDAIEPCSLFSLCHYFQLTDDEGKNISIKHDPVEDAECTL